MRWRWLWRCSTGYGCSCSCGCGWSGGLGYGTVEAPLAGAVATACAACAAASAGAMIVQADAGDEERGCEVGRTRLLGREPAYGGTDECEHAHADEHVHANRRGAPAAHGWASQLLLRDQGQEAIDGRRCSRSALESPRVHARLSKRRWCDSDAGPVLRRVRAAWGKIACTSACRFGVACNSRHRSEADSCRSGSFRADGF